MGRAYRARERHETGEIDWRRRVRLQLIDNGAGWNDNGRGDMREVTAISTTKPPCWRADALAVLMRLRAAGHVAYFAGGCVRDLLLGGEPKDWDVATDAP